MCNAEVIKLLYPLWLLLKFPFHLFVVFLPVAYDTTNRIQVQIQIVMEKTELKKEVESLLKDLPEDAEWDDLMYKIYVRQSIEQGLKDSERGRIISHEEIKKKYKLAR
jgi:Tfp pilus assembly protein PilO